MLSRRQLSTTEQIAALFSIVESNRKLGVPIRHDLADVLPGLADRSIQALAGLTPARFNELTERAGATLLCSAHRGPHRPARGSADRRAFSGVA